MTAQPERSQPTRTLIKGFTGDLISVDIARVEPGDLIFLGGDLIRRVLTPPAARLDPVTGKFAFKVDLVTKQPPSDPEHAHTFHAPVGTAYLVLRPQRLRLPAAPTPGT